MTSVQILLEGDGCWPDFAELAESGKLLEARIVGVALLPDADVVDTLTGRQKKVPSITVRLQLPDGLVGVAQIKVEMWEAIGRACRGRMELIAAQSAAARGVES